MKRFLFYFADLLIILGAFAILYCFKGVNPIRLPGIYVDETVGMTVLFMIIALIMQKERARRFRSPIRAAIWLTRADLTTLAACAILVLAFKLGEVSRILIFGSVLIAIIAEILMVMTLRIVHPPRALIDFDPLMPGLLRMISRIKLGRMQWLLADLFIITVSFLFMAYIKPATQRYVLPFYLVGWVKFLAIWLTISLISDKYRIHEKTRFRDMAGTILGNNLLTLALVCVLMLAFKLFNYSRMIVWGTIFLSTFLELLLAWLFHSARSFMQDNPSYASSHWVTSSLRLEEDIETVEEAIPLHIPRYDPGFAKLDGIDQSILSPLLTRYLDRKDDLFLFLNEHLALENIHKANSFLIDSEHFFNVETQEDESLECFFNFHRLNDARWINRYLIRANQILKPGGIYIGIAEALEHRKKRLSRNLPALIAAPLEIGDFLIHRVCPKMSFLKGFYFTLTRGMNRPLSRCEVLGRLYYCGFKVHETFDYENKLYFIAIKDKPPSTDPNPSYGPLFRMKRSGKDGKRIYVLKFRTMHPYAEYLQHYMVERYGYGDKGKIDDDFRVTAWGKFMRKFWLDELPQLINLAKGDLALVGVRPLSDRFLKEYPEDLRRERALFKPGCIPPYVALRMQKVEDYMESERIYLRSKQKHPLRTDVKFFFWAVFNILTNRIRSE
jgi:lipopolysaccharide/colanic/teichoic acid biosynthesis glycosyltransferase